MKKGNELTIEQIKKLKDGSKVYFDYIDGNEFDLEYCEKVHINTYYDGYKYNYDIDKCTGGWFEDKKLNQTYLFELIKYIENNQIKVYSVNETNFKNNYEKLRSMTIKEMAKSRIYSEMNDYKDCMMYKGDFKGFELNKEEAIKKELEWLKQCE